MIKQIILLIVIFSSIVLAYNPDDPLTKLEYGQNATLDLKPFTRHNILIYEDSAVQFNLFNSQGVMRSVNEIIIKEIGKEETKALISIKGKNHIPITLKLGNDYQINYTGEIPFIFIEEDTLHYEENKEDRYIILYFNLPGFEKSRFNPDATGNAVITLDSIKGTNNDKSLLSPTIIAGLIGLILILGILYYSRK